ncbi:MAG: biotin transporter BioY [bacterium]|nr:biotin transporter BioY [bacterium]
MSTQEGTTTRGRVDEHAASQQRLLLRLASVPLMTLIIIICSHIAIPTSPLGIPITMQTLGVLLCALALGPRLGFASIALYLVMGIVGVGVFGEGEAGLPVLLGQTGGYLLGFLFCQPVAHAIIKRPDASIRGWLAIFAAGIAVHMVVFVFGVPWLHWIHSIDTKLDGLSWVQAIYLGFVVFIPGMLLKTGIATVLAVLLLPSVAKRLW